jgi:glycosyltransferase involved in cell wall biosynthesis
MVFQKLWSGLKKMPIKVAHFAPFAPSQCGLYATARDLILGERLAGVEAELIDDRLDKEQKNFIGGKVLTGDGITTKPLEYWKEADILVRHGYIPKEIEQSGKPIINCLHGRPESSYYLSLYEGKHLHHLFDEMDNNPNYKYFVTFWPEYVEEFNWQFPNKVKLIQAPVDLNKYSPEGEKFDWGEKNGTFNILVADIWRDDVKPYNTIIACAKYIKKYNPTAKLHIIGLEKLKHGALHRFLRILREQNVLGYVAGIMKEPEKYFRAADIVVTNHIIDTRVVREAMACGCPVVKADKNYLDTDLFARHINCEVDNLFPRCYIRSQAEERFDYKKSGQQMKKIFEEIFKKPREKKVLSKIFDLTSKGTHTWYKDTICEQHRRIYDRLAILYFETKNESIIPAIRELEKAFISGMKVTKRLVEYKIEHKDLWKNNTEGDELRKQRVELINNLSIAGKS